MVTGSHNPSNYNGFKMMLGKKPFFGKDILNLGARAAAGEVVPETTGTVTHKDVSDAYVARLLQDWDGEKKLSVVWDNGNGAAGDVLRNWCKSPRQHKILNGDIDGTFPDPPSGPDRAEKPRTAHRRREAGRCRRRHRLRRRRRPHRPRR